MHNNLVQPWPPVRAYDANFFTKSIKFLRPLNFHSSVSEQVYYCAKHALKNIPVRLSYSKGKMLISLPDTKGTRKDTP